MKLGDIVQLGDGADRPIGMVLGISEADAEIPNPEGMTDEYGETWTLSVGSLVVLWLDYGWDEEALQGHVDAARPSNFTLLEDSDWMKSRSRPSDSR